MEKTLKLERLKAEEEGYEAEMIGWHQRLNGYEFEQTLGDSERQGSLVCCLHAVAKSQTRLSDQITCICIMESLFCNLS